MGKGSVPRKPTVGETMIEEALDQAELWVEKSINKELLPETYSLPLALSFLPHIEQVDKARRKFIKEGWRKPEVVLVPRNLRLGMWSSLLADANPYSGEQQLEVRSVLQESDEIISSHSRFVAAPGWRLAVISGIAKPLTAEDAPIESKSKHFRPQLETYLALQLKRLLRGDDLTDLAKGFGADPRRETLGLATILQERVVHIHDEDRTFNKAVDYAIAGATKMHKPGVWVGRTSEEGLARPIGFRPAINDVMQFEPQE